MGGTTGVTFCVETMINDNVIHPPININPIRINDGKIFGPDSSNLFQSEPFHK
jgi:hypothetical protein